MALGESGSAAAQNLALVCQVWSLSHEFDVLQISMVGDAKGKGVLVLTLVGIY